MIIREMGSESVSDGLRVVPGVSAMVWAIGHIWKVTEGSRMLWKDPKRLEGSRIF
jgi:hypothetical protein